MAKPGYFERKVEQNKGDSGKLWAHLKSLGYAKVGGGSSKIVLEENGNKVFEPLPVSNIFNRFYTTVASDLVSKLPTPSGVFSTTSRHFRSLYGRLRNRDAFVISPVSRAFIRKQLLTLNPKKAIGLDNVSSRFLRDAAEGIIEPISHIVNLSIMTENVPVSFKHARVVPLFKKGSTIDPGNYRPVSVLNVLSKILERAVCSQMNEYLDRRKILFENQSGFRGRYSTDTCLADLTDYVKGEMTDGKLVGMVCIDLRKAFDTVDHSILLDKLHSIGASPSSVNWFRSYLSGRQQCVEVDGVRSDFLDIDCGVPQGSILGPQLFLIYINDMYASLTCRLSLYADDSALFFSHKDPNLIANRLSMELSNCKNWLTDNKLSLHVGKTECLLFGTKRRLGKVRDFTVTCDGTAVGRVLSVSYLGVILDSSLSGNDHVSSMIKKCVGRIAFLYRNSSCLDLNCRRILCSALIQPYFDYCCSSWYSGLTGKLRDRLDVLQRRMVRYIYSYGPRDHVDSRDIKALSWLLVKDRVRYFKLVHVHKVAHKKAPDYLAKRFVPIQNTHSHNTRSSAFDYCTSKEMSYSLTGFSYTAIKEWNDLPNALKAIDSEKLFRRKLHEHFSLSY